MEYLDRQTKPQNQSREQRKMVLRQALRLDGVPKEKHLPSKKGLDRTLPICDAGLFFKQYSWREESEG